MTGREANSLTEEATHDCIRVPVPRLRRALPAALRLRLALGVGILALMTMKPGAVGSTLISALAAAAGAIAGVSDRGARRTSERRGDRAVTSQEGAFGAIRWSVLARAL